MANIRFVLFIILAFMCYSLWQQWQLDYGPKPPQPVASDTPGAAATAGAPGDTPAAARTLDEVAGGDRVKSESLSASANRVLVTTDTLRAAIDPAGGDLRLLELLQYPISKNEPDRPFRLLTDESDVFIAQAGLLGDPQDAPTHHSIWTPSSTAYTLEPGQDSLRVPLTWTNGRGLTVTKTYTFQRGSYSVQLEHRVENRSAEGWTGKQYVQLQRTDTSDKDKSQFVRSYLGGVLYTPEARYEKISFSDMTDKNLSRSAKGGWVAMIQHYFLAAWIPSAEQDNSFYTKDLGNKRFLIGATGPDATVAPGQTQALAATLYAGPKLQRVLEATAPGLELTVDFGALTVIAKPIFWLLEWFHKLFNNWGFAIISVTLVIKALFFKLSEASYRSMANMRKLQPKLQELKERCGDDRQRFNQAMMEMYRKERVNPLGGCLPILVQIPVFIALYWVLAESVELRQAPFLGWLNDLSARDPYYVLPLIMVISMVIQQKLNPAPADPVQAKVMQFFPYLFGGFFAFFPSGLVLYWVVNNILSIAQQWYITKQIEKPAKSPA